MKTSHKRNVLAAVPLTGPVQVPGEVAASQLAMACGLLSVGTSHITGVPHSPAVSRMAAVIAAFGGVAEPLERGSWLISGTGIGTVLQPVGQVDVADDHLAMAIGVGVACSLAQTTIFRTRTPDISGLVTTDARDPWRQLFARTGATWEESRDPASPGFIIRGVADTIPFTLEIPAASPTVKTAALFAALNAPGRSTIIERAGTWQTAEAMLAAFGAPLDVEPAGDHGQRITVTGQPDLVPRTMRLPADPQLATIAMLLAALVPGSELTIGSVPSQLRVRAIPAHLLSMGADLRFDNARVESGVEVADLTVRHVPLRATDLLRAPSALTLQDMLLMLVAASSAMGRSHIGGLNALSPSERATVLSFLSSLGGFSREDIAVVPGGSSAPRKTAAEGAASSADAEPALALANVLLSVAHGNAGETDAAALEAACAGLPRLLEDTGLLAPEE